MPTLQNALVETLTAEVVIKAERVVKREGLPLARQFAKAVAKGNANSLDRLKWLCEVANGKPTEAKVAVAKKALLDFVGKHSNPTASSRVALSREEFLLLDKFYHLEILSAPEYSYAGLVWDNCSALHLADEYKSQTTRWC
jgi:hypothetical protein